MTCPDCDGTGGGLHSTCDLCEGKGTIGEVEFAFFAREDPELLLRLLRSPITPDADLALLCEAAGGIRTRDMSLAGDVLQALTHAARFWPTANVREGAVRGLDALDVPEARRMLTWVAEHDEDEAVREAAREATE